MARLNYKIDFGRKRYGAAKWQYENFDCVDLYIELLILLNCQFIDRCRWIIEILHDKWDNVRFIDLDEALKMANFLKKSVSKSVLLEHFTSNCRLLKWIIRTVKKYKKGKTAKDIIFDNEFFFLYGIKKYIHARKAIFKVISSNNDIYRVNDCKDNLMFI